MTDRIILWIVIMTFAKVSPVDLASTKISSSSSDFINNERRHGKIIHEKPNRTLNKTENTQTDELQCSIECKFGDCEQPNNCICKYSGKGTSCNETNSYVTRVNGFEIKGSSGHNISPNWTEHLLIERMKSPNCQTFCDKYIEIDLNYIQLENMTCYLVPIDSPCNIESSGLDFWKKFRYPFMGAAIGMILLISIVCVLRIICANRRKRRTRNTKGDLPLDTSSVEYTEINSLYS